MVTSGKFTPIKDVWEKITKDRYLYEILPTQISRMSHDLALNNYMSPHFRTF